MAGKKKGKGKGKGGRNNQRLNRSQLQQQQHQLPSEELTGTTLPEDVIVEILCRTPAKSLVRFRCVCKSWLSLIYHPNFIKLHLNRNISSNTSLLLHGFAPQYAFRSLAQFRINEPLVNLYDLKQDFTRNLDYPRNFSFDDFFDEMVFCGSVNGIICLSHAQTPEAGRYVQWGQFAVLWNPSVNSAKLVMLPPRKSMFDIWQMVSVGLGYDAARDDYKIIRLVPVAMKDTEGHIESRVEIYYANTDSWKAVDKGAKINFSPALPNCSFISKGVPYWDNRRDALGAFDPRTGKYKKVPYPNYFKNKRTSAHPMNMMDSISVLVYSPGETPNHMIDVYVLDDRGSWMKRDTIGPIIATGLRMPQCLTTGEIVVETWEDEFAYGRTTYFYDPKTSHLSTPFVAFESLWYESYIHVESLVSVKGMEPLGKVDNRKKKMKPRKDRDEYLSRGFELVLRLYAV